MISLHRAARFIRHLPVLERADYLWDAIRGPYRYLLDFRGRGTKVIVGRALPVRMPSEFTGNAWESFEPEAVSRFVGWMRTNPGGLVLDIGSSLGIYSAVALFADKRAEVVAFDSDLASLAAVRRLCRYAEGNRLGLVHGFIAHTSDDAASLALAMAATEEALAPVMAGSPTRYICLGDTRHGTIPCRRLDDLISDEIVNGRRLLIKCDVEGAELLVLTGAEMALRRYRPTLLVSVHPEALPAYGDSKQKLQNFLRALGYDHVCLAIDHEEHWWCELKG